VHIVSSYFALPDFLSPILLFSPSDSYRLSLFMFNPSSLLSQMSRLSLTFLLFKGIVSLQFHRICSQHVMNVGVV